jgi:MFS transporter, NNP family, nitrate/nitrite transporter
MSRLMASLSRGNWKSLIACFVYFDTGFTAWVLFGPLAPFISRQISLSPAQSAFLVAVPVLAASIVRVTLGNLFQCVDGTRLALLGIALSAVPSLVLLTPVAPGYHLLLVLGAFLGLGGASFAIALPIAGSSYPPRVQGLVLGLAAAGNVGAVLDGFVLPGLAEHFGWRSATAAVLPLLALAAAAMLLWSRDESVKSGSAARAFAGLGVAFTGLIALVLLVSGGALGSQGSGQLLLPLLGALLALAVLPRKYLAVLAERDAWALMLVYSITFGGFVGMSSYVSLLLTTQYGISKVGAGLVMGVLSFTGAMVRPVGGLIADRVSGVRALLVVLLGVAISNLGFAALMPPLDGGIALLAALYLCFGLGNGATFQLVPHRWKEKTGLMTGIIGAAGGIGGFYLPVVMGIVRQGTGSYRLGFAVFGTLAALAFLLVLALRERWLVWALAHDTNTRLHVPAANASRSAQAPPATRAVSPARVAPAGGDGAAAGDAFLTPSE